MAETAVLCVLTQVYRLLTEEGTRLNSIHKEFADIKDELESIQAFMKDADKRAEDEGDTKEGIRSWVKQLRELSFRIEDAIDEYDIYVAQGTHHTGCIVSLQKIASLIKTVKSGRRIVSEIQDIKLLFGIIKERSERYNFQSSLEQGSSSSRDTQDGKWHDPRLVSLFVEEAEVVGFEYPRDQLVGWLVDGVAVRTVISVVGMGGLGKTTLANKVFDNQRVKGHFDCRARITVSQSYTVEALLRKMMKQLCNDTKEPLPRGMDTMDKESLISEVRCFLQAKRYVIFFDDVWKVDFWDEIQLATLDNKIGSRIIITTRNLDVAKYCKKSSPVQVHKLQPLPPNKAWELFCKKTFQFDFNGNCPLDLQDISSEIVKKCEGLPLAIVAIGGLLSTKDKTVFEWQKLCRNLSLELQRNPHLASLSRILALSYDDLPYYLKSCLLYFGIYPEDYSIRCVRLIRQWVAEGFVKCEEGKSLEEVAEEYLTELINRSLVQLSDVRFDGKGVSCRIHDLLREMIIKKMKDLSFCHVVHGDVQPICDIITRRLAITTSSDNALRSIGHSRMRSMYIFESRKLPQDFMSKFYAKSKLMKVLDLEGVSLDYVPNDLGYLLHLRYLSLRNTDVKALPKSIGKLQNLETMDLKETLIDELPSEINKLTKLRYLAVFRRNYHSINREEKVHGVRMKKGIKCLTPLQKLYHVKADHGGLDLIRELRNLKQLRKLGLKNVRKEYGNALCASVKEMKCLEFFHVSAITEDEILDLQSISSLPKLRRLSLFGRLEKLPNWVPRLQYLVGLTIRYAKLTDDPLKSLKDLPNLLRLSFVYDAYDGEMLHFEVGFLKLKRLYLVELNKLNSIVIDSGALPALEHIQMMRIPQLKEIPCSIHLLENLETLYLIDMQDVSINRNDGRKYLDIKHVSVESIRTRDAPISFDYRFLSSSDI